MKYFIGLTILFISLTSSWAMAGTNDNVPGCCAGSEQKESSLDLKCPVAGTFDVANNNMCPVMGNAANGQDFTIYDGKVYGFCCPDCKPKFESEPDKYIGT